MSLLSLYKCSIMNQSTFCVQPEFSFIDLGLKMLYKIYKYLRFMGRM